MFFSLGRFLTRTTAVWLSKGGASCTLASSPGMRCLLDVDFRENSGGHGQDEVASGRAVGTGALKGGVMEGRSLDRRSLQRENAFHLPRSGPVLLYSMYGFSQFSGTFLVLTSPRSSLRRWWVSAAIFSQQSLSGRWPSWESNLMDN